MHTHTHTHKQQHTTYNIQHTTCNTNNTNHHHPLHSKQPQFLEACITESLRLFPPVLTDSKTLCGARPLRLPSGPLLRPGDVLTYKIGAVQRNPAYWAAPAQFRPARWLERDAEADLVFALEPARRQALFCAFHAGRRLCLGLAFLSFLFLLV